MRQRSKLFGPIDEVLLGIFLALIFIGLGAIFTSQYQVGEWNLFDLSKSYGKQVQLYVL